MRRDRRRTDAWTETWGTVPGRLEDLVLALGQPATVDELRGEETAADCYREARRSRRRGNVLAGQAIGVSMAAMLSLSGALTAAAYANVLPRPMQGVAHHALSAVGVPAEHRAAVTEAAPGPLRQAPVRREAPVRRSTTRHAAVSVRALPRHRLTALRPPRQAKVVAPILRETAVVLTTRRGFTLRISVVGMHSVAGVVTVTDHGTVQGHARLLHGSALVPLLPARTARSLVVQLALAGSSETRQVTVRVPATKPAHAAKATPRHRQAVHSVGRGASSKAGGR
ncbi:hypothetical protein acdb102_28730 [Acidothermaceae bacterium B102]|nr:hypothetical protein acdb102_28730 [Acidothermaceae bacterium B102]